MEKYQKYPSFNIYYNNIKESHSGDLEQLVNIVNKIGGFYTDDKVINAILENSKLDKNESFYIASYFIQNFEYQEEYSYEEVLDFIKSTNYKINDKYDLNYFFEEIQYWKPKKRKFLDLIASIDKDYVSLQYIIEKTKGIPSKDVIYSDENHYFNLYHYRIETDKEFEERKIKQNKNNDFFK